MRVIDDHDHDGHDGHVDDDNGHGDAAHHPLVVLING
jgi:hypothetical protein